MVLLTPDEKILFPQARKRFGYREADKQRTRTYEEAQAENPYAGFYRTSRIHGKLIQQRLPFYDFVITDTIPQQITRAKFHDAMTAWSALSDADKLPYKKKGKKLKMNGSNVFVSEYMLSH